jgi:hypothetical protein
MSSAKNSIVPLQSVPIFPFLCEKWDSTTVNLLDFDFHYKRESEARRPHSYFNPSSPSYCRMTP